jgi:hypothetical protein
MRVIQRRSGCLLLKGLQRKIYETPLWLDNWLA